jgi:hypothetical protein
MRLTLLSVLLSLALYAPACAGKRVALVIGNGAYIHANALPNPRNDAADMAEALKAAGFTVIAGADLDKTTMEGKIRDFAIALADADTGVFFYSGHGLQVSGVNYLVPVNAGLTTAAVLELEMIRLDTVQRIMEGEAKTNILFLDACRDNPLARNLARAMGTRSAGVGQGLAPAESGVGTLISFSTQPGNVALDGAGRNSPFTGPLVRRLGTPGEDILSVLTAVRNDVLAATGEKQVPWENHALRARFYFNPAGPAQASAPAAPGPSFTEVEHTWNDIKDSKDISIFEAFRAKYGPANELYGKLATRRIEDLKGAPAMAKPVEPARTASEPNCGGIAGTWAWAWGGPFAGNTVVTIRAGGIARAANGGKASWNCAGGGYVFSWDNGNTDHLALSADGRRLSGSNNWRWSVSGARN